MVQNSSKSPAGNDAETVSGKPNAPAPGPAEDAGTKEIGGRGGPDPTRYGDWEKAGRCIDF